MSEVVNAKSSLTASNQVKSSLLDDATNSEPKSSGMLPFPMIKPTIVKPENWMGALVNKEYDNKGCMGKVVSYCCETKLFKINYDNSVSEEVDYERLKQIIAPPPMVDEYLKAKYPEWYNEMEEKRKRSHQPEGHRVPVHPRWYSSATLLPKVEPKKTKGKRETGTSAAASRPTYIPLAFRETKRDAYMYY